MSEIWALALGIAFLVIWVSILIYLNSLWRAYILGQTDFLTRKNRTLNYSGPACWAYNQGRRTGAVRYKKDHHNKIA